MFIIYFQTSRVTQRKIIFHKISRFIICENSLISWKEIYFSLFQYVLPDIPPLHIYHFRFHHTSFRPSLEQNVGSKKCLLQPGSSTHNDSQLEKKSGLYNECVIVKFHNHTLIEKVSCSSSAFY